MQAALVSGCTVWSIKADVIKHWHKKVNCRAEGKCKKG